MRLENLSKKSDILCRSFSLALDQRREFKIQISYQRAHRVVGFGRAVMEVESQYGTDHARTNLEHYAREVDL